jgi:hypothetical protein
MFAQSMEDGTFVNRKTRESVSSVIFGIFLNNRNDPEIHALLESLLRKLNSIRFSNKMQKSSLFLLNKALVQYILTCPTFKDTQLQRLMQIYVEHTNFFTFLKNHENVALTPP